MLLILAVMGRLLPMGLEELSAGQEPFREALSASEKERLRRAGSLSAQMKVYSEIAQQYVHIIRQATSQEDSPRVKEAGSALISIYREAGKHMQQSPEKKKHKHLKQFEISLRGQVSLLKSLQSSSSSELHDLFIEPIAVGEYTRKQARHFIFQGGDVKKS